MTRRCTSRWRHLVAGVTLAVVLSSCASLSPDLLPRSNGDRDGYDLVLEFESVLNLPDRARVVMDGVGVGLVTDVSLAADRVKVTSRIDSEVVVPEDIHGTLKQPTVLGDIFVALERPAGVDPAVPVPPLRPGDTVPLARTTAPTQIEDTIASLSHFVASGSIQRVQNTVIGLNQVAETSDVELRRIAGQVSTNLTDLADNLASVDLTLSGLAGTAAILSGKRDSFENWFSPAGMLGFDRVTQVTSRLSVMIPSIGSVYSGGFWLVPMLTTVGDAMGAVQASKWAVEREGPRWRRVLTDYFLPQDKYPAINITSITGPDGREMSDNVADVLRMLGAVP